MEYPGGNLPFHQFNLINTTFSKDYATNQTLSTVAANLVGNNSKAGHWIFKGDRSFQKAVVKANWNFQGSAGWEKRWEGGTR